MTLKDFADLAQITLFPAIFISLVGLWFTLNDSRKRDIERHNSQWQKVVIYSMLNSSPLSIAEIRDRYLAQATQFGLAQLGRDRLGDISILAAVLDLIAHNAVVRLPPTPPDATDRFAPSRANIYDPAASTKAMFDQQMVYFKQTQDVRTIIDQNEGRFTEYELSQYIRTSTRLGQDVVDNLSAILSALEMQGQISRDENQKLSRASKFGFKAPNPAPALPAYPPRQA